MTQYIDKSALVAEIEKRLKANGAFDEIGDAAWWEDKGMCNAYKSILSFIDTLEVKDIIRIVNPYDVCVQYTDREAAIKAHTEDYSWNIESELFQQLTPEQQKLWRKEIEQACISGGYSGLNLTKDTSYKENLEVKEVDLIISTIIAECCDWLAMSTNLSHDEIEGCRNLMLTVKEEQLKVQKGEEV